ncbi:hypothetical protein QMU85_000001 [Photobacterium damselae]|uniref:hypothetical protein n=1 Tax=Photobacterium damselae TaxID=38293 RepID=UPI0023418EE4|nr:hypothetical protein [Photobacterium damselae]ELV7515049.1 hypothetical protein [Photobacterium damselae]MDC4168908.1 hypothetical protein [Photobacterium damselae]
MIEPVPVNFSIIRYFLDMFRRNPEHNTLVVGKRFDDNHLFVAPLVNDAKIAGFYVYPNCRLLFWRRWSMRKSCIYILDIESTITLDPNNFFSDAYPLSTKESTVYKKYGYKVIVKSRLRNYTISDTFQIKAN